MTTERGDAYETYLIGRDIRCDLQIGDLSVSRMHAELIVARNGTAMLTDRTSTNGTYVETSTGWKEIQHRQIKSGMQVKFGDFKVSADKLLAVARRKPDPTPPKEDDARDGELRRNPTTGEIEWG